MIAIGIDTHKATLAVSAIDGTGREVTAGTFPNDTQSHAELVAWADEAAPERRFGVEGSGSHGAAFARLLVGARKIVVEVPADLTERERRHLRHAGKTDAGPRQPGHDGPIVWARRAHRRRIPTVNPSSLTHTR